MRHAKRLAALHSAELSALALPGAFGLRPRLDFYVLLLSYKCRCMRHALHLAVLHAFGLAAQVAHVASGLARSRLDELWTFSKVAEPLSFSLAALHLAACWAVSRADCLDSQAV